MHKLPAAFAKKRLLQHQISKPWVLDLDTVTVCMCVCTYEWMNEWMDVCVDGWMYVYVYIYMYMLYIYIYIYIKIIYLYTIKYMCIDM